MSLYRGRPEVSAQGQGEPFELEGTCHDLPPTSASDPQKKSISVAAIGLEVTIEELVQAVTCIVRCLAVVFHPVIKQGHAGLKVRVIESVVRAGIDNAFEWRPVVARSRGVAHATAISAGTTHQTITTMAWKVTVLGNGVSLESSPELVVRARSLPALHVRGASAMMLLKFPLQYNMLVPQPGQPFGRARSIVVLLILFQPEHDVRSWARSGHAGAA